MTLGFQGSQSSQGGSRPPAYAAPRRRAQAQFRRHDVLDACDWDILGRLVEEADEELERIEREEEEEEEKEKKRAAQRAASPSGSREDPIVLDGDREGDDMVLRSDEPSDGEDLGHLPTADPRLDPANDADSEDDPTYDPMLQGDCDAEDDPYERYVRPGHDLRAEVVTCGVPFNEQAYYARGRFGPPREARRFDPQLDALPHGLNI